MHDACGRPVVYRSMNRSTTSRTPPLDGGYATQGRRELAAERLSTGG
jgi:hypothetical protein